MDINSKFAMIRDSLGQKYVHHDIYLDQKVKIKKLEALLMRVQIQGGYCSNKLMADIQKTSEEK